jgi:Spy/CpxP family protein refolding chaperone
VDDLGLTAEQKAKTLEILQARRPVLREAIRTSSTARRDLVRATQADPPDEAAVRAAARRSALAEEELALQRARLTGALREILSPAQKKRLARAQEAALATLDSRARREGALLDAWIQDYGPAAEEKK